MAKLADLQATAANCGLDLTKEGGKYCLRDWEGNTTGPFTAKSLAYWLAGYSRGMHTHAPDCACGRTACQFRAANH